MIARKFSLLRQLVWAATLAAGFGVLWFALWLWLGNSIQEAWRGGRQNWPPREYLVVRNDGSPLILSTPTPPADLSRETCRDLSGRAQDVPDRDDQLPAVSTSGAHGAPAFFSSRLSWHERLKEFTDEKAPTVNWFFVHDGEREGAGYFVGYDRVSNGGVGFIGLSGFHSQPVPASDWIPVRGDLMRDYSTWSSAPVWVGSGRAWVPRPNPLDLPPRLVYVPSGNRLRLVDLSARTVTTVWESPEPIESPGIPMLSNWSSGRPTKEQPILVRTTQRMYALDRKHNVIRVFTIPTEVDRQSQAQWYEIGNGEAITVFFRPNSAGDADNVSRQMVYRIAANGAIREQVELTLKNGGPAGNKQAEAYLLALGLPAPSILFFIDLFFVIGINRIQSGPSAFLGSLGQSGPPLFVVWALSSVLAFLAWRRARSFGLSNRDQAVWATFVLLFGVAAYLGFILYRRWPIRQPCPTCHAQAPRDRATCAACGTLFPDLALKGTEIFA